MDYCLSLRATAEYRGRKLESEEDGEKEEEGNEEEKKKKKIRGGGGGRRGRRRRERVKKIRVKDNSCGYGEYTDRRTGDGQIN